MGCVNEVKWPLAFMLALMGLILAKAETVLFQSIIIHPSSQMLQLSTARGLSLPSLRLLSSTNKTSSLRRMTLVGRSSNQTIALADISTVVINEGLSRWNGRYYLGILRRHGTGILVPFDRVMPAHAVLLEVYHGIRRELFETDQGRVD